MLLDSTIYTPVSRSMTMDIKNYYLGKTFEDTKNQQYICIPIDLIPQKVIDKYILMDIVHDGYV